MFERGRFGFFRGFGSARPIAPHNTRRLFIFCRAGRG
jgi:hypothetical protein